MATVKESPIQTKSALGPPQQPGQPRQVILPKISQVDLLWGHYKAARGTLERLAAEGADAHSAYADRALRLLEVLVLRKEKGAKHFLNMTLGCPVIANNPGFDPQGDGKRRGELPPTEDLPELISRAMAELDHAMLPHVRPGGRALDVSLAAKNLQEGIVQAKARTTKSSGIPQTEAKAAAGPASASCFSSSKAAVPVAAALTDAGAGGGGVRQRPHRHHHKGHGHSHGGGQNGGCSSSSSEQTTKSPAAAMLAAAVAWVKAALSGPEAVKEHLHVGGGGCCGKGAAGRSRMGAKQDGHAFMVAVLLLALALPFMLWWMS